MKTLIAVIGLCVSLSVFGQFRETVELKNGTVHRGAVIEQTKEQVKLRKKDGSVMVFDADDVVAIDRYAPTVPEKGYYLRQSFGILGGYENAGISHQLVQGYAFNRHFQLGAGFGFELFRNPYVPAFVEFQYNILNKPSTPYVRVMGGYEVPIIFRDTKGGFTYGISVGYTKFINHRLAFTTSLGYRYARLIENQSWWDDFETIRRINRFELTIGITFR